MPSDLHEQLIQAKADFDRQQGMRVVLANPRPDGLPIGVSTELPDLISWRNSSICHVSDAKTSIGDAKAHFKKPTEMDHRIRALGSHRSIVCPQDVIKPEDLPSWYGLYWLCKGEAVIEVQEPVELESRHVMGEMNLLIAALAREQQKSNWRNETARPNVNQFVIGLLAGVESMSIRSIYRHASDKGYRISMPNLQRSLTRDDRFVESTEYGKTHFSLNITYSKETNDVEESADSK